LVVQLGYGRQHAGRGVRRTRPGVRVDHRDAQAALGTAPRDRESDDPGADDDHVPVVAHLPSLPGRTCTDAVVGRPGWWSVRAPCAGITRIRFDGRRLPAALSARSTGLPCEGNDTRAGPGQTPRVASAGMTTASARELLARARLYLCVDGRQGQGDL